MTVCGAGADRFVFNLAFGSTNMDTIADFADGSDDIVLTWHVLSMCARNGGAVAEPLDRAAATLRSRQAIRYERQAYSAQARLSAKVLTLAPVAFALWMILTTSTVRDFLASTAGSLCILFGAALNSAGWLWMRRIVSMS